MCKTFLSEDGYWQSCTAFTQVIEYKFMPHFSDFLVLVFSI